jgi:hypothetical protein
MTRSANLRRVLLCAGSKQTQTGRQRSRQAGTPARARARAPPNACARTAGGARDDVHEPERRANAARLSEREAKLVNDVLVDDVVDRELDAEAVAIRDRQAPCPAGAPVRWWLSACTPMRTLSSASAVKQLVRSAH